MSKTFPIVFSSVAAAAAMLFTLPAHASVETPDFIIPDSSIAQPGDHGVRMHTNFFFGKHLRPNAIPASAGKTMSPNVVPYGITPAQLHSIYNIPENGGSNAIAIVDAYGYKTALSDFNYYSSVAGLPQETSTNATSYGNKVFQVVYPSGRMPSPNSGWNTEEALDIEAAHAMAPYAKIYLVEASGATDAALYAAVRYAATLPGVKEISMSWSGGEYSSETTDDANTFNSPGVVYLAASGDNGAGVGYPAASKNVIGVGGTTLNFSGGTFTSETGWSGSGGGPSAVEARPSYQNVVAGVVGSRRGVPDLSADADPNSGIGVYENGSWYQVGGTSLATPLVAAMINVANDESGNTAELSKIYSRYGTSSFRDITSGNNGYACAPGYDFVTGVGSPNGLGAL